MALKTETRGLPGIETTDPIPEVKNRIRTFLNELEPHGRRRQFAKLLEESFTLLTHLEKVLYLGMVQEGLGRHASPEWNYEVRWLLSDIRAKTHVEQRQTAGTG